MTDPLGRSQIIPYLAGLSKNGYKFTILSCEKTEPFLQRKEIISSLLSKYGIKWVPVKFTSKPPVLSKIFDVFQLRKKAFQLYKMEKFDMIHCRSYIAATIGLALKKQYGVKFFFDMRGFWADEKRDGGAWKDSNPFFRQIYKYYKRREAEFIEHADYIIMLTYAAQKELQHWPSFKKAHPLVEVIPCCADMDFYSLTDRLQKKESRAKLNIAEESLIASYLGSLGSWYMIDEMLLVFKAIKEKYPAALFLFITQSDPAIVLSRLPVFKLTEEDIKIFKSPPEQVPDFIKSCDISFSFIKPVYSKISSSPTKLGELLSMGIPVVCNKGVGDVEQIITETSGGFLMQSFDKNEINSLLNALPEILQRNPLQIRMQGKKWYDLNIGIEKYNKCYTEIFS
jgi:glycosyltransferase involved in cell wall biosynthesis